MKRVELRIAEGPHQGKKITLWRDKEWLGIKGLYAKPFYAHLGTVRIQYVPFEHGNSAGRIIGRTLVTGIVYAPLAPLAAIGLAVQRHKSGLVLLAYRTSAAEVSLLLTDKSVKKLAKAYEELVVMLS